MKSIPAGSDIQTRNKATRSIPMAWREAAVFGALWGAVEITVGSFLHATRIPLSGVIMSSVAVALLVAGRMLIGRRWFPLLTALVCAALRSLSPEGFMPGPMAAIIFQGFLVSLLFMILKSPLAVGLVAGFIAAIATQVQSLIVKLIVFGGSLMELFLRLVERAEELLHLKAGYGWIAVGVYLLLVGAVGAAGGLIGRQLGQAALKLRRRDNEAAV